MKQKPVQYWVQKAWGISWCNNNSNSDDVNNDLMWRMWPSSEPINYFSVQFNSSLHYTVFFCVFVFFVVTDQHVVFYDYDFKIYTLLCIGLVMCWITDKLTFYAHVNSTSEQQHSTSLCIIVLKLLQSIQEGCCMLVAIA